MNTIRTPFVEETRFGNWFIGTKTWKISVLCRALTDLQGMMPDKKAKFLHVMDVGCGFGQSFEELATRFSPKLIVGLDADPGLEQRASTRAQNCSCEVRLNASNAACMNVVGESFDLIFCHQTFHHIVGQEAAMAEFFRVLKPGGVLLFAESTKRYIHSLPIRILFRHPMDVQKTADEYVAIIRAAGFHLPQERISLPYLWWSRPDIGFFEWIGFPVPSRREETLINAVAVKPT